MTGKGIKNLVRENYGKVARQEKNKCGCSPCCCGATQSAEELSMKAGYSGDEISEVPEGANLGLGCGNPVAIASLKEGETVLDLGSGPGFDCFLAANRVGKSGRVIGVDMTPDMLKRARKNAENGGYTNVESRQGEIEDCSVDVIISNCVINLSPDKQAVFNEAFRVLSPGGRINVSDIVVTERLPDFISESGTGYTGCIAGALQKDEYLGCIEKAGFRDIEIVSEAIFPLDQFTSDPVVQDILKDEGITKERLAEIEKTVLSVKVRAYKK
ncbi:arsenite methyltransferase [Methanolacinia petrolearia]|uniref:arsenite methyltransferase n=1 Tax=Methanolacinia petrolearia TaxID=54120 RepID=UPI003BAA659C